MGESYNKIKELGGYFELELRKGEHYHRNAICLNSARNCFEYVLLARKYTKVFIPYYTCEVMLQPLHKHHIAYEFYNINESLEPTEVKQLHSSEAFLYTNYYGLKQDCVEKLSNVYGNQLIVDNSQSFFSPRMEGIDTFYSVRKFFGVPDGAYLYTDCLLDIALVRDKSFMRMQHLLQRIDEGAEKAYVLFRKNDDSLDNQPIKIMSLLSEKLLRNIDYQYIIDIRISNYQYLDKFLSSSNMLNLVLQNGYCPMIYPYLTSDTTLREKLIENKIFVAKYWPNVLQWCNNNSLEYQFTENILPIPIDQRYSEKEMRLIVNIIINANQELST